MWNNTPRFLYIFWQKSFSCYLILSIGIYGPGFLFMVVTITLYIVQVIIPLIKLLTLFLYTAVVDPGLILDRSNQTAYGGHVRW